MLPGFGMGTFELLARRGGEGRLGGGVKFHLTVSGLGVPASAGQAPDGNSERPKKVRVPPAKAGTPNPAPLVARPKPWTT